MQQIELRLHEKHAELEKHLSAVQAKRTTIKLDWLDRSHHAGRVDVEPVRNHAQEKTAHQIAGGHMAVMLLAVGIFTWLTTISVGAGHELLSGLIAAPVGFLLSMVVDTITMLATGAKSADFSKLTPIKWIARVCGTLVGSSFAMFLAMRFSQDHELLNLFPFVVLALEAGLFGLSGAAKAAHHIISHDGELCDEYENLGGQEADLALAIQSCQIQIESIHEGDSRHEVEHEIEPHVHHHHDDHHDHHDAEHSELEPAHHNGHSGEEHQHFHHDADGPQEHASQQHHGHVNGHVHEHDAA